MRTVISLISLAILAPLARADRAPAPGPTAPRAGAPTRAQGSAQPRPAPAQPPPVQLAPIDLTTVPAPCTAVANQASSPRLAVALPARISLARCLVDHAIAPLALCDCGASIVAIDAAVAPAIALLDDVIAAADPAIQVIAEHALGQLYAGFAARLQATLPRVAPDAGDAERGLHDLRAQTLEAQLAPWHETALAAFQQVVELARAHPELAGNPETVAAVRDAEQHLAAEVATR